MCTYIWLLTYRKHVGDGTLVVEETDYIGCKVMRLSAIAVKILLGRTLTSEQKLKVSQTELERLLDEEESGSASSNVEEDLGTNAQQWSDSESASTSESPPSKRPRRPKAEDTGTAHATTTAASPGPIPASSSSSPGPEFPLKGLMDGILQEKKEFHSKSRRAR
jgi:hypothetical protein